MKKQAIGHIACPVCDHPDAQVKEDKNGHAFIFCPDCAAQTFTRNDFRDKKLRSRMRAVDPVTVTVTEPIQTEPPKQPVTVPTVPAVPKPQPAPKKPAAAQPVPNPPKKKAGWFSPLLAGGE